MSVRSEISVQLLTFRQRHLHLVIKQTLLSKATYNGENSQAKSNKNLV